MKNVLRIVGSIGVFIVSSTLLFYIGVYLFHGNEILTGSLAVIPGAVLAYILYGLNNDKITIISAAITGWWVGSMIGNGIVIIVSFWYDPYLAANPEMDAPMVIAAIVTMGSLLVAPAVGAAGLVIALEILKKEKMQTQGW